MNCFAPATAVGATVPAPGGRGPTPPRRDLRPCPDPPVPGMVRHGPLGATGGAGEKCRPPPGRPDRSPGSTRGARPREVGAEGSATAVESRPRRPRPSNRRPVHAWHPARSGAGRASVGSHPRSAGVRLRARPAASGIGLLVTGIVTPGSATRSLLDLPGRPYRRGYRRDHRLLGGPGGGPSAGRGVVAVVAVVDPPDRRPSIPRPWEPGCTSRCTAWAAPSADGR